jgi:acyl-coenzyme A synthetase/AMP-(fatty) acid ligase
VCSSDLYKRPRYYRFVDQLPMTATGKLIHYKARQQAQKDMKDGLLEKVSGKNIV